MQPSTMRGIPDVSINAISPDPGCENGSSPSLKLDLEQYFVPSPIFGSSIAVYAANLASTPRTFGRTSVFAMTDGPASGSHGATNTSVGSADHAATNSNVDSADHASTKKVFTW